MTITTISMFILLLLSIILADYVGQAPTNTSLSQDVSKSDAKISAPEWLSKIHLPYVNRLKNQSNELFKELHG